MQNLDDKPALVIDLGTSLCRVGLAGEEAPQTCFPTMLGRPKEQQCTGKNQEIYIGHDAHDMLGLIAVSRPVENGIITNWNDMELVWEHLYEKELGVSPDEHSVLLTETPENPKQNREKLTQYFFEQLHVPSFYMQIGGVLSLCASGRTTGLVLESGEGVTQVVPIYEGYSMEHAIMRTDLAGHACTDWLIRILKESGCYLATSAEREVAKNMKESICYVSFDYESELNKYESLADLYEINYELPDGTLINIKDQTFRCPELLFNSKLNGFEHPGFHELVYQSVKKSAVDVRRSLFGNILLTGGSTLFPGIPERLTNELTDLAPSSVRIRVLDFEEEKRHYSAWAGGSLLSSLSFFKKNWISRDEYQEFGPQIVFKKCY